MSICEYVTDTMRAFDHSGPRVFSYVQLCDRLCARVTYFGRGRDRPFVCAGDLLFVCM